MKKLFAVIVSALLVFGLTSCDDSVLSKSSAKKALKKEAVFDPDFATAEFSTGYYEVDEDDLNNLARLKAAGMVNYSTETVIEKVTRRDYSYWSGTYYYTVDVEHTFANVSLTEEGLKYVIEEPTRHREDLIKDLKANKDYEEAVPDYMKAIHQKEVAPAAQKPAAKAAEAPATDTVVVDTVVEETVVEEPKPQQAKQKADNPNRAYEAATAKVNRETHNMLLGHYELEKVKEVRCSDEMAKNGVGECMFLYTFKDKTPFGFVLGAPAQDYVNTAKANFIYYQDLGWVASSIDK